ncbi:hypothetical protein TPHA_0B00340 [Tetrapisispora phaffii CBS 4417]|uniref:Vacuolar membrane-associated protein IML1 n=1 Tax=Tetrapisispora phaffii (strain ATCC 24235 / CBS 4417 / NBRC 1672 / NRRL Y-8282 / UCD 70-5) TaxID=1071381 RepID=G8BQA9_TETPH|nr:hypothetical protein TPHA_0B00340 [Tetrapisispora phaffii CBS 4417]CCE61706.1 hypothetical protein TPHA_0B00340 [Tetrapisispora phaffii CBS 4417]
MFSSLRKKDRNEGKELNITVQKPQNRLERLKRISTTTDSNSSNNLDRSVYSGKADTLNGSTSDNTLSIVSGNFLVGSHNKTLTTSNTDNLSKQNTSGFPIDNGTNFGSSEVQGSATLKNQKYQLELTYHDLTRYPNIPIMVDLSLLPGVKEGELCELMNYDKHEKISSIGDRTENNKHNTIFKKSRRRVKIYFIAKNLITNANRLQHKSQQLSIASGQLQALLELPSRSKVWVKKRSKEECEIDLLELNVKDLLLNRGDMWCISKQLLASCVFSEQKLFLTDSLRLVVNGIYRDGRKILSGYIGESTRIVFRSESARLIFIIQITEEMWNFEESGEQLFQKLINSLFPKIFKKWKERDTHHSITIAFAISMDMSTNSYNDLKPGEKLKTTSDYYRIVVDQVNIIDWVQTMEVLRREFMKVTEELKNVTVKQENGTFTVIKGRFTPVIKSNFLELVNFAATILTDPFKQLDLKHTTTHVILISPSSGIYDVDYDLLKLTGKKLMNLEMTMDLICLARSPLHIVPLFRYIDYDNNLHHCTPSWLSIFFWNDGHKSSLDDWQPRCNLYKLRIMGLTENEMMEEVDIAYLSMNNPREVSIHQLITHHDRNVFHSTVTDKDQNTSNSYPDVNNEPNANIISTKFGNNVVESSNKLVWNTSKLSKPKTEKIAEHNVMADLYIQNSEDLIEDVPDIVPKHENAIYSTFSNISMNKVDDSYAIDSLKHISKTDSIKEIFGKQVFKRLLTSVKSKDKIAITQSKSQIDQNKNVGNLAKKPLQAVNNVPSSSQGHENSPIIKKHLGLAIMNTDQNNSHNDLSSCQKSSNTDASSNITIQNRLTPFHDSSTRLTINHGPKAKLFDKYNTNSSWNEIENPSVPVSNEVAGLLLSKKWRDVLPRFVAKKYSKWRSFTIPAELPLTITTFVNSQEFKEQYEFRNHSVTMNIDQELYNQTSKDLLLHMVYMRLVAGFQICLGDQVEDIEYSLTNDKKSKSVNKYISDDDWTSTKFYMMLDTEIHRITCGLDGVIDVQRYLKREQNPLDQVSSYMPLVKTRYEEEYRTIKRDPLHATRKSLNWNQIDQALACYGDYREDGKYAGFKAKFVVLPVEIPLHTLSTVVNGRNEMLSSEELRLEGLRRLTAFIAKSKIKSSDEKVKTVKNDEQPPDIHFYTGSLINFINEEIKSSEFSASKDLIISTPKTLLNKSIDFKTLTIELQSSEDKLTLVTRKWHWSKFKNCFVGSEMVNWLIRNFSDIETREDAIAYGQYLMDKNVFLHVLNKHGFLDGYYFYQLTSEYALKNKDPEILAPGLKVKENYNEGKYRNRTESSMTPSANKSNSSIVKGSDEILEDVKPTIVLSNSLTIDLDPDCKSYKKETCVVHYDKVHNPDHCFHIRLEWLSATPKLIDDKIKNWSRLCEKYGLLLIEVPWEELCSIPASNPFHTFIEVKLAINPFEEADLNIKNMLTKNKFYYHIYLLKKSDFLLDNRAFHFLNDENSSFVIKYSWGAPTFKNAQYIHKSGAYIAEIKDNGDLFLAPNNIYMNRTKQGNIIGKNKKHIRMQFNAQGVMLEFKNMCSDPVKLRSIFEEAKQIYLDNEDEQIEQKY